MAEKEYLLTQIEKKDARIKELKEWADEQDKAKQWFLGQIAYKDELIAALEKGFSLRNKFRVMKIKIFNALKTILTRFINFRK